MSNFTEGATDDKNYLDPLEPSQSINVIPRGMFDALKDFNDYTPLFNQPAQLSQQPSPLAPFPQQIPMCTTLCLQDGCNVSFKRVTDRIRHEAAVHGINKALYLCHVPGCNKSQGLGYTRQDKLTEHLWKKHGNLGFVKRA